MSFLNMSLFAFALFLYPIAVLGESICDNYASKVCPVVLEPRFGNIITSQDMKDVCPKFLNFIDCLGNYDATCGDKLPDKIFPEEGEFESIRDLIVDICDESSLLHTVITENVECLRSGIFKDDNNTCYGERAELAKSLRDPQSAEGSEYEDASYSSSEICFLQLYSMTCYVEYVADNCGTLAKDAVIEVLNRAFYLKKYCNPEAAVEFSEELGNIKARDSIKDIMREFAEQILKKKIE